MDNHLGFRGTWTDGWVMYDGTIVVLYHKPGQNGDAYYTRKANYGLNVQVQVHLAVNSFLKLFLRLGTHLQTSTLLLIHME